MNKGTGLTRCFIQGIERKTRGGGRGRRRGGGGRGGRGETGREVAVPKDMAGF